MQCCWERAALEFLPLAGQSNFQLDRALQINTAALAVMGAVFLGLGHESPFLPVALAVAAVGSATLTNVFRWLRLNRIIANLVALAAVAWSLRNFLNIGSQDQLLAIADMLVYLQIVLLFQDKTSRVYWQLIVLSLLQVVVAAALDLGPQFGALLALYMALALSALVLLCLYRDWRGPLESDRRAFASVGMAGTPAWQALLAEPQVTPFAARDEVAAAARPALVARQVALLGGATLAFAAVFFYATPRLGEGSWSGGRGSTHAVTGFRNEAQLEEFGRIHQSNQLVMRVSLSTVVTREPYPMIGDPYFTGTALGEYVYDGNGGRWKAIRTRPPSKAAQNQYLREASRSITTAIQVRQEYMLEGSPNGVLFAIVPAQRLDDTPRWLEIRPISNPRVQQQESEDQPLAREIRYALATTALTYGRQLRGVPHFNPLVPDEQSLLFSEESQALLKFDEPRFPKLAALASEIVRSEVLESASSLERALALERHFQSPARYKYSLSLDFIRNRELDPIEDFVANHRTGHCEYFASALVMMLRSQGIPARMVIGYRGGDLNSLGGYYQVRQKHAHAWVDALLPASEVPEWEIAGKAKTAGVWYRLDPTPMSLDSLAAAQEGGVANRVGDAFDYVEILWRDYVLSLNSAKQKDSIYDPVSNRALGALPAWLEARSVNRIFRRLAAQLGWDLEVNPRQSGPIQVFDWRIGVLVSLIVLVPIVLSQAVILLLRLLRWWWPDPERVARKLVRRPPRFYLRLQSLLGRLQLRRSAGQTARELALAAEAKLHAPSTAAAATLPAAIVEAYYRVRFGGAALDSREEAAIEHALAELTPAVNQARP
jgi:transglutaminase-like putative cysteine protease